jgi:hypothetical protein
MAGVEARSSTTRSASARAQRAHLPLQMQHLRRAFGRQPPKLRRMQRGPAQLRDLIGRSHRPQHRKRRPAAGVRGQPHPLPRRLQPRHVEQPRPDEAVRRRAMHQPRADLGQPGSLARLQMDRMAIQPARPEQPVSLIGIEIIPRRRIQRPDPCHLVGLLAQMGLHQAVRMLGPKRPQSLQLHHRGCGRKARRDRIARPSAPVPAGDQGGAVVIGTLRRVAQPLGGGVAVHAGLARDNAHIPRGSGGEQGIDAAGVDGAEDWPPWWCHGQG